MYYIFNQDGKNIGQCDFEPNSDDLASRGESHVWHEDLPDGHVMSLVDGKISIIKPSKPNKKDLQSQIWEQIKAHRYAVTRGGVYINSVGKWFHSDDASRAQYLALQILPSLPDNLMWKTMDNTFVKMTKELLAEIAKTMMEEEQANFANAERHRMAMLQADNPLEYDYSTGWSETYE